MTDTSKLARKSANVHSNIAQDVWPNGAILSCKKCRYSTRITSAESGGYLARGWPKHCGATMRCDAAAAPSDLGRDANGQ